LYVTAALTFQLATANITVFYTEHLGLIV